MEGEKALHHSAETCTYVEGSAPALVVQYSGAKNRLILRVQMTAAIAEILPRSASTSPRGFFLPLPPTIRLRPLSQCLSVVHLVHLLEVPPTGAHSIHHENMRQNASIIYRTRRIHGIVYIILRGWKTDKVCGHKYAVTLS